jgi:hypothetical protein
MDDKSITKGKVDAVLRQYFTICRPGANATKPTGEDFT